VKAADEAKFTPESRVTFSGRVSTVIVPARKAFRGVVVYIDVACS